jgi:hypothetical protein
MSEQEEKLTKQVQEYAQIAKENKKVDVAALVLNAFQKQKENRLTDKEKRWGYLVSLGLPPFGLIFAFKFYLSGKDDGEHAAWICGMLTAFSILVAIIFLQILISGSGVNINQIQQIKPSDIQQLYQ